MGLLDVFDDQDFSQITVILGIILGFFIIIIFALSSCEGPSDIEKCFNRCPTDSQGNVQDYECLKTCREIFPIEADNIHSDNYR